MYVCVSACASERVCVYVRMRAYMGVRAYVRAVCVCACVDIVKSFKNPSLECPCRFKFRKR